ncbi:recombinase family protein [Radiobacillus kanasensis]|uniref:recombinase family protein n=1 Tax=Radiobacillus kanasensis TaxID=2844358 RepID=UPI001E2DB6B9|nr:recombinase family protein [Radiobacillus kanasensis]UFU00332.1 recombinase family protein [Radiobacillus kanasensis]
MYRPKQLNLDIYLRKSRLDIEEEKKAAKEGREYDTLSRHRKQLLSVAKKENHNIQEIHDEVVSGEFISERPKIQNLLRRVEAGLIEAVLVVDLDRLGRGDMLDQGLLDRAFRYSGTKIITPTEYYDPEDESWELVFGVKSLVARQELKAITRRLQNGRRNSVSEGKSISKKPPYGYLRDEHLKLYPDPDTAWAVKKMFQMMKEGHGRKAVSAELDKLGVSPPTKNNNWSSTTITAIIRNEVYLGHMIWGKVRYQKKNGRYNRKKVPESEWVIHRNAHEPIVSQELWDAANTAHSGRFRPSTVVTKKLSNPLAGIVKCDVCGYVMRNQPRKDRPNSLLRCAQPSCKGVQKGSLLKLVEKRILESLEEYINQFEIKEEPKTEFQESDISLKERAINKKEKEIDELNTQKNNLHDLLERGVYDIDTFVERQQVIVERIKKIQDEVDALKRDIHNESLKRKNVHEFVPKVKKVLDAYHQTDDIEKKNRLLKSILEKATYLRKKDWNKQDQFQIQLYPKI